MARSERVSFAGSQGTMLAARLELPAGAPRAYALFAHCFTCSKETIAATRISRALAERGIATLRFDFTGLGGSEGDFANTDFSSNVDDLVAAAEYLRSHHGAPKILVGHSLGGAAVIAAAARVSEAVAVATIAAPADPGHVAHLLAPARPEIEQKGEAEVAIAGRTFRVRRRLLDDIAAQNLEPVLRDLRKALLVFHAPRDQVVGIDNAGRIFAAARHPKSFVSLDDADHLLTAKADADYVGAVLAAWAGRYLDTPEEATRTWPGTEPGWVTVAETGEGRFTQAIMAGPHRLRADEPAELGGDDTGPGPYDLLLAGLGACTAMTLRMYAERKQWPMERVSVRLKHDKIHAEDCATCETEVGKIDQVQRELTIEGALDEEQRRRLVEIADKCPVHRTLESENLILTRLLADDCA